MTQNVVSWRSSYLCRVSVARR